MLAHEVEVAGLGSGIATYIYNTRGANATQHLHHIGMHASARRVGDDEVGATVLR